MVRTSPSNAEGAGSIPGQEAKILHASWPKNQNIKQKQYCNEFNKDFSDGPCQKKIFKKIKYTILVKKKKNHNSLYQSDGIQDKLGII